jgi:hypothetical protein
MIKGLSYKNIALWLVLFSGLAVACKKKNQQVNNNPVPYTPVAISMYPNDPLNFDIQVVGGWKYIDGGLNGIIVYKKSEQEFVAIERTSSYLPDNKLAKVSVAKDNFTLRDTVSGSEWRIFDGSVTKAPAVWPLRVYGASYDGNLLRITN